jgi:hypothetical protein
LPIALLFEIVERFIFSASFHTIERITISNTSPQLMSFFHAFVQLLLRAEYLTRNVGGG